MLLLWLVPSLAQAQGFYQTRNFTVHAPTRDIAEKIAEWAEYHRKRKAIEWLGHEMPAWGAPCEVNVKLHPNRAGGATKFWFDRGQVLAQQMSVEGSPDRLTASILPHEVTHTVFAYKFRRPPPRWADEGGAVLSEDQSELDRHDAMCRQALNRGTEFRLRELFDMKQYPARDPEQPSAAEAERIMVMYAQGYSVSAFWIRTGGKPQFLEFVDRGMREGWDAAIARHCSAYGYRTVEDFERAWLTYMRMTKPSASPERQLLPPPGVRETSTFPGARPMPGYAQPAPAPPSGGWSHPVRPPVVRGAT